MADKSEEAGAVWPAAMGPVVEHMRMNAELISHVNQIVSRAANAMAARQSAVLTEAISDLTTLLRTATASSSNPPATTRAYAAYVEAVLQRGVAQLNFNVETLSDMSASALELARRRFASGEDAAAASSAAARPGPVKK